MRYSNSIFMQLLEPISRRWFATVVQRHGGDAYDKSFSSWQHLVALIFAQLTGASSMRSLAASWNANSNQHYHLGCGQIARSTLSDANARRPTAIFEETFAMLSRQADRTLRREGRDMIRLIDSSPIPLDKLVTWSTSNGRIRGMKLHVVYDPDSDHPRRVDITPANVNDVETGRQVELTARATYVFDKGYCDYAWWSKIHTARAFFVTRTKNNLRLVAVETRKLGETRGDGFCVVEDVEVTHKSQGNGRLTMPLRRIRVTRDAAGPLTLISNDMTRSAVDIARLYKARWQIELLFRWIKQNLELSKFLGRSENAVRLQVLAAMIAFLLLRIAARRHLVKLQPIRFVELVGDMLHVRKPLHRIDKPPKVNPSVAKSKAWRSDPAQAELAYG